MIEPKLLAAAMFQILRFSGVCGVRGVEKYDERSMDVEIDSEDEVEFMELVEKHNGNAMIQ